MSTGSDEPTHGREYPPLEDAPTPPDPYAPVDYPSDTVATPPNYGAAPGYPPQYGGGYGYGYDPYAQGRPAGTNGKAIASMVTSLAGLFFCGVPSIVGLILGIIAMREVKRTGQDGHGMALAGIIVGALAIVGWILYVIFIVFMVAVTSTPSSYY